VIGSLLVLAVAGADLLRRNAGKRLLGTSLLLIAASAVVLVPARLAQVEARVAPRALVAQRVAAIDADVVIVPPLNVCCWGNFIRNDPLLTNRPLFMAGVGRLLGPEDLPGDLGLGRVHVLTDADVIGLGSLQAAAPSEPD
jgi:hypothetical protein